MTKLAAGMGIGEEVPKLLTDSLRRVGATEIASYRMERNEEGTERILTATDRGLADVRLTFTGRGRQVTLTCALQSWDQVSARVTVTVRAGMGDRAEGGTITLRSGDGMTIERERYSGPEFDDFASALLEYGRCA